MNSNDSDVNITVTLNPGTYTIKCTPIGIGSAPAQGSVPTPVEDTGGLNINSRNSDVFLKSTGDFDSNIPTITLKNNGSDAWNLKQARIPFATGDNQSEANVTMDGSQIEILRVADGFSSFGATIPANGEITLKFNFTGEFYPGSSQPGNGWFIFTVEQSQGNDSEFRNYFISDGLNTNTNGGEDDDCPGNSC